jgi:hypothetical protein
MKTFLKFFAVFVLFAAPAFAQSHLGPGNSRSASAYQTWSARVVGGPYTTSNTQLVVSPANVVLSDGYTFEPWATTVPLSIGQGANNEALTPTAVSIGACPTGYGGTCATLTFSSLSYTHGSGDLVTSGTSGIEDAIYDASQNGGGDVLWFVDCGALTLSTSSATNTLACKIPNNYVTGGVGALIGTTITTATSYSVGIASHTTDFLNACTAITATNTAAGCNKSPTVEAANTSFAMTAVIVTASTTPGAGAISHLTVWGKTQAQPAF